MTKFKICGLMNKLDMQLAIASKVDILGFVVNYPISVPWNITQFKAKELLSCIPSTAKSCIVTGGKPQDVLTLAIELLPDYVQLHYNESFEETQYLAETLLTYGIKTIKALPIKEDGCCEMPGFTFVFDAVKALSSTKIEAILLDSRSATSPVSSSRRLSLELCRDILNAAEKPIFLSGGITGNNLEEILRKTNPFGIDVLTGTEDAPGQKNKEKIEQICCILDNNKCHSHI